MKRNHKGEDKFSVHYFAYSRLYDVRRTYIQNTSLIGNDKRVMQKSSHYIKKLTVNNIPLKIHCMLLGAGFYEIFNNFVNSACITYILQFIGTSLI